ncbi:MAG: hypothetical protein R6V44_04295 [Paracoccaceae bacterium]
MQADFMMGVPLLKREDESLYEYWLSFSPMAPIFGVPWRFAPSASVQTAAPAAETKTKPAPAQVEVRTPPPTEASAPALEVVADMRSPAAPEAEPASEPEPAPADDGETHAVKPATLHDSAPTEPDDLKAIKGVGPKLEAELNAIGLYTYEQIAALTPENLVWIDDNLTSFKGRSVRDDWVGQAADLMKG